MSKFDFNSAETENADQSAVEQSIYNVKTDGNKARTLKATTALAGALALGVGVGLGAAALAPAYADDATSTGKTATTDETDAVQGPTTADQVILIDGSGTAVYTYDGTSDTSASIDSIGFVDADEDGVPLGASSTSGDTDDANKDVTTVSGADIVAGTLNVLGGTSATEASAKATTSSDNSDASLTINDSIGGTYSYVDGNGDTQTDGTASLTKVNVTGQQGAKNAASESIINGGSSTLDVGDNIYATTTTVEAGAGGEVADSPVSGHNGGDGGESTLTVGGDVVGGLVVTGGAGSAGGGTDGTDAMNGGAAVLPLLILKAMSSVI